MEKIKLLPHRYKIIGWVIFGIAILMAIGTNFMDIHYEIKLPVVYNSGYILGNEPTGFFKQCNVNILENIIPILTIIGLLLIGFSEEKEEDEYFNHLRLKAVFWSMKVSYIIFLLLFICVFGFDFLHIMLIMAFFPLLLYVLRLTYLLYKNRLQNEK